MSDGRPQMRMTGVRAGAVGTGRQKRHAGHGVGAQPRPLGTRVASPHQQRVLDVMGDEPLLRDAIAAEAGMSALQVQNALQWLKGKGLVARDPKGKGWVAL